MIQVGDTTQQLLANGNIMRIPKEEVLLTSPELIKKLQLNKEESLREIQFSELIMHVLEQIEKESDEDPFNDKDLWPEVSPLDMKKFLKADVNVTGVSGSSPIFILDSVNSKIGQTLHNFNIFEISQLAACTKVELSYILKQTKNLPSQELEFALQDAKSVMDILDLEKKTKAKEVTTWNAWGNLSQVGDLLQIKENSKKFANMMGHLSPKNITASIAGVLSNNHSDNDDIDSFEEM